MDIKRIETLTTSELLSEGQVARVIAREVYVPDMSTAVGRLKHLRHVIENVPEEQFNIDVIAVEGSCGTIGCIIGHAALDPHFQHIGLRLEFKHGGRVAWRGNDFGTYHGDVAAEALGVTEKQGIALVTSGRHSGEPGLFTKEHAYARIDRLISTLAATP